MGVVVIGGGGGGGGGPGGQKVVALDDGRLMEGEEVAGMFDDAEEGKAYARMLNAEREDYARFIPYADGVTASGFNNTEAEDPRG